MNDAVDIGICPAAFDPGRWEIPAPPVAKGMSGYVTEFLGALWIVMIIAEPQGEGHCGRYLDSLTQDKVIVVEPNPLLSGMLDRRGYNATHVKMPTGETVAAHVLTRGPDNG